MAEQTEIKQAERANRAVRVGEVVSAKGDKTCVIKVTRKVRHPVYSRFIKRSVKLYVHDEENTANTGDTIKVMSTRPLSKLKRWRLVEVLERAR